MPRALTTVDEYLLLKANLLFLRFYICNYNIKNVKKQRKSQKTDKKQRNVFEYTENMSADRFIGTCGSSTVHIDENVYLTALIIACVSFAVRARAFLITRRLSFFLIFFIKFFQHNGKAN